MIYLDYLKYHAITIGMCGGLAKYNSVSQREEGGLKGINFVLRDKWRAPYLNCHNIKQHFPVKYTMEITQSNTPSVFPRKHPKNALGSEWTKLMYSSSPTKTIYPHKNMEMICLHFTYITLYWDGFGTFSHIYSSYIQPKCVLSGVWTITT